MQTKRIAILFSGNGSNLEAIIKTLHQKSFKAKGLMKQIEGMLISGIEDNFIESNEEDSFKIEVVLALSNVCNAYGLQRANNLGIPIQVLPSSQYTDRKIFDRDLVEILKPLKLDLCVLAGFMRILTPIFTQNIRSINIHPSLLPLYKGAHGIVESYASPMCFGGVSVHYVNEELDSGEIIAQGVIAKIPKESLTSYETRIHKLEHLLYPLAILKILTTNDDNY